MFASGETKFSAPIGPGAASHEAMPVRCSLKLTAARLLVFPSTSFCSATKCLRLSRPSCL
jgi:hypothetical protein